VPSLQCGAIVIATVQDPRGTDPKTRPIVILSSNEDIAAGKPVKGVAVTTQQTDPSESVELPWHRQRHSRTGLREQCRAHCKWIIQVDQSDVQRIIGVVPGAQFLEIAQKVASLP
jgi:mRNA-degrading endonuclease toxin of MazEF toxin-antitoxin module